MLKGEIMIQQDDKIFQLLLESIEKKLSIDQKGIKAYSLFFI